MMRMTRLNKKRDTNNSTKNKFFTIAFFMVLITVFSSTFASAASPPPVELGSAGNFGVLAASAVTNTGPTMLLEDLGLSPNDNSSITGFFEIDSGPGIVNGEIHAGDAIAAQAQLDLTTAYVDAAGRSTDVIIIASGELGGLNLTPGLYRSGISSFALSTGNLTLDAQGDPDAVFIFQMPSSTFTVLSDHQIILAGEASACNIFWQVGSSATLGTDSIVKGNILAFTSITLATNASLEGKALARNGAVTLDNNDVFSSCANTTASNATNLTVTKIVINDNNGTAVVADFALFINSTQVLSGVATPLVPSTYIVSELGLIGYNGTISGDCTPNGTVILASGESKQCTITNDDITSIPGNQTNTTGNQTNTTGNQTNACYVWLKDIPAVCIGGTITQNTDLITFDNCRHVTCVNETNTLEILACEKPDEINPTYFEMYLYNRTGEGIQICLGDACIEHNGFDTQEFPVCVGNATLPPTNTTQNTGNQTNTTGNQTNECYDNLAVIPATCVGGTITFDDPKYLPSGERNNCRNIVCESGNESISVKVCEKPTEPPRTYFEIYLQSSSGNPPQICIAEVCLTGGYTRSQDYPICMEEPVPEPDPDPDPEPVCAETVGDLPASCEGGTFTTDSTNDNCRTLVCSGSGSSMQVLACNKPDGNNPEYFEMYKQSQTGNGVEEICLADSCITNGQYDGYERGAEYPICSEEPPIEPPIEPPVEPPVDPPSNETSVELSIKQWYPQGRHYVFICEESGYDAESYLWIFGDNQTQTTTVNNVYHVYASSGDYEVMCEASNGATESDTLQITVS